MTSIQAFLAGAALAALFSLVVVWMLRKHLAFVLTELSGSVPRAQFWSTVCCLVVLLLGLFSGTGSGGYETARPDEPQLFFGLVSQVRYNLLGLLGSVLAVAWIVVMQIRRNDRVAEPWTGAPRPIVPSAAPPKTT